MKLNLRKLLSSVLRWGIAIIGIYLVIRNMSLTDHALVLNETNHVVKGEVVAALSDGQYRVIIPKADGVDAAKKQTVEIVVPAADLLNPPDRKKVRINQHGTPADVFLLGMDLAGGQGTPTVRRLLVSDAKEGAGRWIAPGDVIGGFQRPVPHPKIDVGLKTMVMEADLWLLVLSLAVFPATILLTSIRWQRLLSALDIPLSLGRTLVLNAVGMFYNTCIPMGSTGGDVLKAYYAAAHTHYKTRAVMSVIVDRVIGLIGLIILGGLTAGSYWLLAHDRNDPSVLACRYVAGMSLLIIGGTVAFLVIGFNPRLRAITGFEKILSKLPMQKYVQGAIEVMAIYRQRPMLMLWAMMVTFPVHITVIVSALLAGMAFGLPLTWGYYFIVVPVTVLVGAIPISPQGAGVMEYFAILLTARQGATISQAFALTMSIRTVQILWSLLGGVFVISGHYRAPTNVPAADGEPAAAGTAEMPKA